MFKQLPFSKETRFFAEGETARAITLPKLLKVFNPVQAIENRNNVPAQYIEGRPVLRPLPSGA